MMYVIYIRRALERTCFSRVRAYENGMKKYFWFEKKKKKKKKLGEARVRRAITCETFCATKQTLECI